MSEGFLPTDAHGYVMGADAVLAAGDATTFPIKQGGLATQQADAAAATIAHALGANVEPMPFAPVLRGLLLTGGAPLYLRAELDPQRRPALRRDALAPARRRGLLAGALVAAGQGRRPLSRAIPVHGPPRVARRGAARSTACPAPLAPATPPSTRRRSTSRCCSPTKTPPWATSRRRCTRSTLPPRSPGGVLPAAYAERRERWLAELTAA